MASNTKSSADSAPLAPSTRFVRLNAPGVIACGDYQAGQVYEVDAEEAERLIGHKGFVEVAPPAEPAETTTE